ncbi:transposable element Tcb1 transposase [Trichonephila clavipes]|nr:transposable element Tcb1 transposase [Trichonephila clavipes]
MALMDRAGHLMSPESITGVVCKTVSVCMNSLTSFVAVCTLVLSARRPWLRLPLTLHSRQERVQWWDQRRTWTYKWRCVIFSNESRFYLQHQDCRIRIWCHRGERILTACIRHRHTGDHLA